VNDKFIVKGAIRRLLPRRRHGNTYKFHIADLKGFFTVSEYEDGTPGELFINVSKQGSTLSGLMDSFAISVSHGLQYGVPLKSYVKSLRGTTFAPSGITDDPDIHTASSITDYIMRRLALDYLSFDDLLELGLASLDDMPEDQTSLLGPNELEPSSSAQNKVVNAQTTSEQFVSTNPEPTMPAPQNFNDKKVQKRATNIDTAPLCSNCGNQTQRAGNCFVCSSCGSTTGCS
jgi:ribonucleoside-diphosphate reductase alpha chain